MADTAGEPRSVETCAGGAGHPRLGNGLRSVRRSRARSCGRGDDVPAASDDAWGNRPRWECRMSGPIHGVVSLGIRDSTPDWAPFSRPVTPNVGYVVLDDVE